ncbi:C-type lectin domain family 14 member A [Centropristis striata]|uniref:C-type lectin domain family 14 member A n=1 Tax=Centropristis striata TaxID=184440 RepID=UPI0027DED939|nr:C-type lectin domain family 14 member A [Centropristis striata]
MEFWFCWVLVLFGNVSANPLRYSIHHAEVNFDQAEEGCSPGVLTTLATEQEVAAVLRLVSELSSPGQSNLTFWVGLKKVKNECVVPSLPLRGFKWTEGRGEDSETVRWAKEPENTCTTLRCATLWAQLHGANVTSWGLIPVTCKTQSRFICKLRDQDTAGTPGPAAPGSEPATPEPEPDPATAEPKPATQKPEPAERELPTVGPEPDLKPETGTEVQGPGLDLDPGLASDLCEKPYIPESRFITLVQDNASWVQVDCYSVQLEVHCTGRPATWRLQDGSPANFTTICHPCAAGFRKNASGHCADIDECSGGACKHNCLNTVGSFRCFCVDKNGNKHDGDSPECEVAVPAAAMGILVPVLVGLAVLLVLVAVVAVTVKCCLMRRSKKRAMKKAEKMAMKSNDGKDSNDNQ